MNKKLFLIVVPALSIIGCAGSVNYTRPEAQVQMQNTVVVNNSVDSVWKNVVPELGKKFYVINNLDKSSGLINISYTGDPEKYIDCGRIHSYVKNARGERTYDFAAASAHQNFETFENGTQLIFIDRTMNLEGRMNLIFEDLGNNQTRVTANTKYIVTKTVNYRDTQNRTLTKSDAINFNSGQSGQFLGTPQQEGTSCVSNGVLEKDVLSLVK